jgi:flagellar protein FliS
MLYQGAIDFLNQAKTHLANGNMAEKSRYINRTHAILAELLASLNVTVGGELAHNLQGLYLFMLDQLTTANLRNDPQPLEVVVSLLSTLKDGWEGAIAAVRRRAA